jgi:hypothetical protein
MLNLNLRQATTPEFSFLDPACPGYAGLSYHIPPPLAYQRQGDRWFASLNSNWFAIFNQMISKEKHSTIT